MLFIQSVTCTIFIFNRFKLIFFDCRNNTGVSYSLRLMSDLLSVTEAWMVMMSLSLQHNCKLLMLNRSAQLDQSDQRTRAESLLYNTVLYHHVFSSYPNPLFALFLKAGCRCSRCGSRRRVPAMSRPDSLLQLNRWLWINRGLKKRRGGERVSSAGFFPPACCFD